MLSGESLSDQSEETFDDVQESSLVFAKYVGGGSVLVFHA